MQKVANVLGWLGTTAVAVSLVLRVQTVRPEWTRYSTWAAFAGLALILLYVAANWREIAEAFRRRQTRLGTMALTSVLLVLGILVVVNYLSSRRNYRWDLTANKQFSLSDQTRQMLQKLDAPVQALVFERQDNQRELRDRLSEYEYVSKRKLSVEFIDPDRDRIRANQNKVQSYGTVVFNYKGRSERVVGNDEQQLTNALIKVLSGEERVLYFLQGHGERDTASSEREGYNVIAQSLGSENYKVEPLALLQKPTVPSNATAVVIAGPRTDLLQPELDALKRYLDGGGKLIALLDPPNTAESSELPNLKSFLKTWGFEVGTDIVVDTSGVGQILGLGAFAPLALRYASHPIVAGFGNVATAYPMAQSVRPVSGATHTPQTFIETSSESWAETDLKTLFKQGSKNQQIKMDEGVDRAGPVSLGAAVSAPAASPAVKPASQGASTDNAPKPETRVVVIGDSDFVSNNFLGIQGNRDLFLNAVNWAAQQENLIAIRPRDPDDRRITLSSQAQRNVTWLSILVLPAAIFGLGIYNWTRRRR
jgi:ABC-type uncharacterized transport system involved in gliding motility auxiliary subunit